MEKIHISHSNSAFSISFFSLFSLFVLLSQVDLQWKYIYWIVEPCVIALRLKFKYGFIIIHLLESFETHAHNVFHKNCAQFTEMKWRLVLNVKGVWNASKRLIQSCWLFLNLQLMINSVSSWTWLFSGK